MICNKTIVIHDLINVAYITETWVGPEWVSSLFRDLKLGFKFGTRCESMQDGGGMAVITWDRLRLVCFKNSALQTSFGWALGSSYGCFLLLLLLLYHASCCIVTFLPELLDSIIILVVACSRLIVRGNSTSLRQLMSL